MLKRYFQCFIEPLPSSVSVICINSTKWLDLYVSYPTWVSNILCESSESLTILNWYQKMIGRPKAISIITWKKIQYFINWKFGMRCKLFTFDHFDSSLLYLQLTPFVSNSRRKTGRRFRNAYELLNPRVLKISMLYNTISFNVWVRYFVWNFKGYLWNSTQNILLIHWTKWILLTGENLRALRFKSS